MTDIITWMSFALQVWSVYRPILPSATYARRQYRRSSVSQWNLGFYTRTTKKSERIDIH